MATDWFGGGLRLALLGYGLPPLLLAAAALWLSRQRTVPQVPWGWLALFGAVHGTSQWFGEFPRGVAVVSWAEHARWCLVAASFGILYEFGRRGARGQGGWAPPPWATIVLGTLASCGLAAGTAGLNAASRYTFGLAGGLLAASTLWRAAWARDARCCPALSLAAVAMLLFGLNSAAFAPRSALWPASWLNYEALQGSVGPAIHVSRGACVLICAACLWTVARPWHRPAGVRWSLWWPLPVTIVAVAVAGRVAVNWHGEALDRQMRATLMAQVVGIADALDPEAVSRLTFTEADSQSVTFRQIRWQLRAFAQYARLRSVYTLAVRSGHMCFGPESLDEDDPWASPPGTPYSPPTDDLPRVFESGTPTVAGPVTDEYGSFASGLAPVLDPRTGDVLAVVGVDIETDAWSARVAARRLAAMVPAIGVAAILLGGWAVLLWRDLLSPSWQRRLRQTETVMVAGLGGLLTAALWQGATYTEALRTRASLAHLCDVQVRALRQSLRETLDELDSLTRFIEGSEVVTAQEFEVFVRPLRRSSPGEAWAWIPLVQDSGRARLEALLRETGRAAFRVCDAVPDGRLVPAGQRAQYAPIAHVAPTLSGAPPLGYDVLRDPVWSSAVLHAAATGEPSAAVRPATESEGAAIMLARSVAAGPTGRPGGVAACFMNLQPEIARVLQRDRLASSQTTLRLVDLSGEGRPAVLAWWPPQRAPDGAAAGPVDPLTAYPVAAYPLLPAGRAWAVLLAPSPAFISAHRGWAGILALLGGSVLTVVITAFAASVRDRQVRLEHDVRERTRELREYAEHHRIVADFSYDWEMWLGPDADVRYISQSCERITGYPPSAFVEDPGLLGRVVHPDDRLLVERHIAESTTGRTGACELRFRIVTPDDEIRWISHVCQPVHAADGQFLGSRSSNRDITAHYQAEEALRAAHRRMALHMEQTPLAVVECDPGGRV
ncbi:MAG TPA: CHASE domain-containing protein, partial [Armatimonadota bacterium]|nr:CHASE domain-containing protein [Armatimonadota bacterium]